MDAGGAARGGRGGGVGRSCASSAAPRRRWCRSALFASRAFPGANLLTLCLYGALSGVLFLLPFELIGRRGLSPAEVGLVLLPLGLIIGVFARPAGALADRLGVRGVPGRRARRWSRWRPPGWRLGLPGLAAGVVVPLMLLAAGMALVVAPLTTAVMNAAPDALAGAASGVNNAASRLAGLFAVALVGAIAALVFAAAGGRAGGALRRVPAAGRPRRSPPSPPPSTAPGAPAWLVGAALAAAAALAAWIARRPAPADLPIFRGPPLDGAGRFSNLSGC